MVLGTILLSAVALVVSFIPWPSPSRSPVFLLDGEPADQQFPLTVRLYRCLFPRETQAWTAAQMNAMKRALWLKPNAITGELIRPHLKEIEPTLSLALVNGACQTTSREDSVPPAFPQGGKKDQTP